MGLHVFPIPIPPPSFVHFHIAVPQLHFFFGWMGCISVAYVLFSWYLETSARSLPPGVCEYRHVGVECD